MLGGGMSQPNVEPSEYVPVEVRGQLMRVLLSFQQASPADRAQLLDGKRLSR